MDKQCSGNQPQLCTAKGAWSNNGPACPNVCDHGDCVGMCSNGNTQCMGNTPQTCVGGMWKDGARCPYVCNNGTCGGICVPGTSQCV